MTKKNIPHGDTSLTLHDVGKINLLIGKNGSGKSRLLRDHYSAGSTPEHDGDVSVMYINPERSGAIARSGLKQNFENNPAWWFRTTKDTNVAPQYRENTYVRLEDLVMRISMRISSDKSLRLDLSQNLDSLLLDDINALLQNIDLVYIKDKFQFQNRDGEIIPAAQLSSGESEAISLAIDILHFFDQVNPKFQNVLMIDEPEAHLHPDLQSRIIDLIQKKLNDLESDKLDAVHVVIATHSTSILGAVMSIDDARIGIMRAGETGVTFQPIKEAVKDTVPFFGHPLSAVFNLETPLIIEGPDDELIWQRVARSKGSDFRFFPCQSGSVSKQIKLEKFLSDTLHGFYDEPRAISVRDGDGKSGALDPVGPVIRFKLNCYAIENLLVTDEVLACFGTSWEELCKKAQVWLGSDEAKVHEAAETIESIITAADRDRHKKIKAGVSILAEILDLPVRWEQAIAKGISSDFERSEAEHSLGSYLGSELCEELGLGVQTEDQSE